MATVITSECINCGACEPECPNTAIYQGGVEYELNGAMHPPLSNDIFYIVPEKCTECVGFFDQEACAVVCPVDCCVPDPARPENEDALITRARELHPDKTFESTFPSRFRKEGGEAAAPTNGAAAPAGAPAAAAVATPAAAKAAPAASVALGMRVEKPLSPPRVKVATAPPMKEKSFPGELLGSFESTLAKLGGGQARRSTPIKLLIALAQPLLGALPYAQKKRIEDYVSDARFFTAAGATGVNALHNMLLYPAILMGIGLLARAGDSAVDNVRPLFSSQLVGLITAGMGLALLEAAWRMKEGFRAMPMDQVKYRASAYGYPLGIVFQPLMRMLSGPVQRGTVAVDGFHGGTFEDKQERERRYGEVYSLEDKGNGYLLRLEFPRRMPHSAMKDELGLPDEMPPYDYDLSLQGSTFVVRGHVVDPNVRKVAAVSPAFPPDFTTPINLPQPVSGFRHRIRDRVLEVVLLKR